MRETLDLGAYKRLLGAEGGNDDDPRDPGGRTSRGVLQREWTPYVRRHPDDHLPSDVWKAPDGIPGIKDIYINGEYWAGQKCDALQYGVDDSTFDYGVNSGVGRSGRVLRHLCGLSTSTYKIDDATIAAANKRDPKALIKAINDERMAFLRGLRTYGTFGGGWSRRVRELVAFDNHVVDLIAARRMDKPLPVPPPVTVNTTTPGKATPPKPSTGKIATGGAAAIGIGGTAIHWIGAHPGVTAALVVVGIFVVGLAMRYVQQKYFTEAYLPVPGTPVVPEVVS